MNPFEKNRESFRKAINKNIDRTIKESYEEKYSYQKKSNFPEPNKKSKFDMKEKYYETHMKKDDQ